MKVSGFAQARRPQGQYRTKPANGGMSMVYVLGHGAPAFITEAAYREKAFSPCFDDLPTEDEYDARSRHS
jgi:hypothetical protein